ncbi:PEP/pyruvate-binding domain-containing protein, partial [Natronococcus jeotgali]|uniref:PEP/pyruvate-binding domain-containing protein n=1 Tax=Natronococcus jeotgali TaxID=413812 RepID=UPI0023A9504F
MRVETRTGEILEYEVGDQQSAVRATPEGGTETVELDSTDRTSRVLTVEQIQTLVDLGEKIGALFENPQDIEWCLDEGELYVVQSRPITSLFPLPSPLPDDD